jgi:uncharacterized protein (DUF2164 family)
VKKLELSKERRAELVERLQGFFAEQLDQELGELGAQLLLELFLQELGPIVYNQGVRDAHDFVADKLMDLEGELRHDEGPGAEPA